MHSLAERKVTGTRPRLSASLATSDDDVRASQALRYRVFADELGADMDNVDAGLDADRFDPYCQHLLVRDHVANRVIASTRLLVDAQAQAAGGFYSSTEFELDPLLKLPGRRLEIGRTCVDPDYRQGAAIAVLWSGLAAVVKAQRIDLMFGCASVPMHDGGTHVQAIMQRVRDRAMTAPDCRVTPRRPLPPLPAGTGDVVTAPLPPLLKAYFRLGARACGEPCHDPAFNCADILVLVNVGDIDASYSRHFLDRVVTNKTWCNSE